MSNDPFVIFMPSGKRSTVPAGTTVLKAAQELGVDLDSVCGGNGSCAKCQVEVAEGDHSKHNITVSENALSAFNRIEERYKRVRGLKPGRRLGCQACITENVVLHIPPESQIHQQVVRKSASSEDMDINPSIVVEHLKIPSADMDDPIGDLERLQNALEARLGYRLESLHLKDIQYIQSALSKHDGEISIALHKTHNTPARFLEIWPYKKDPDLYGVAIDLGSTTIAGHLINMKTGQIMSSGGIMNPQIRFGEDLMSRVSFAMMNEGGAEKMCVSIREALNDLLKVLSENAQVPLENIVELVAVMNPVMHHILLGFDPIPLGQSPFALASSSAHLLPTKEIDLNIADRAMLYVLPLIAGHVGADAAAVALSQAPHKSEELVLIIDVGTNAEIILGNTSRVLACSSPTGPAFEGAQISSGQRAAAGAIERIEIDPDTKEPRFKVIGCDLWSNHEDFHTQTAVSGITGICGSGITEAVAEMRMAGLLDQNGLIGSPEATGTSRCKENGRTYEYIIYDGRPEGGSTISVTQGDIRAIQLAKSALYAGSKLLMDEFGVDQIDRVVLAGAFGAHISPKHAMVLGMIPDCPINNVSSAGNAAGTGAIIALLDQNSRIKIEELVLDITKIETAIEPKFQEHFIAANAIPHAIDPFENLQTIVTLPHVDFNQSNAKRSRRRRK